MNRVYQCVTVLVVCLSVLTMLSCGINKSRHYELTALRLDTQAQGNFFLGCGSVGSRPVVYYVKKFPSGGSQISYWPISRCIIFEDVLPSEQPYLLQHCNRFGDVRTTEFHIPAGAIVHDFSVDLEDLR